MAILRAGVYPPAIRDSPVQTVMIVSAKFIRLLTDEDDAMASGTIMAAADTPRQPIAPWWHTLLVLAPIAIGSVASAYQHGLPNANLPGISHRLSSYFTVLVEEWFGVFLIWLALRRRGLSVGDLVSGRWQTPRAFFRDLGLAIGFMVVVVPLVGVAAYLLGANNNTALANIPPKTVFELAVFLALTASAGFAEELVFRGYLTHQFGAWTGSRAIAVVLQGIVFGLAHGFYGKAMLAIMLQGWLLGLLAYWRKSLRPGMLAHWLQDSIGGIVGFFS
jgi:membrane protease YdiL (CAAX protease family)